LGQAEGQGVLSDLHPVIAELAAQAPQWQLEDLGSSALGADMGAMEHETMDVRIFRT
jgi:urease accessory protein